MEITWIRCNSYDDAKDYSRVIYLHQWNDKPFYWGKAHNSFFGGHKRVRGDLHASGRYNTGYRHWIEGCLKHGGRLYVGLLDQEAVAAINEVENYLIYTFGHEMNTRVVKPKKKLEIQHRGDVPVFICANKSSGNLK